ncbi:MAG: hypothetical protein C4519_18360 [Desulfobacteraceae bacterium]|nr:MAG: hypothetical protein C4519_18360 [Desulfobacteraceae bacterium]
MEILDTPEKTDERRYFTFFPENSQAVELLETLQTILGLPASGRSSGAEEASAFNSGLFSPAGGQAAVGLNYGQAAAPSGKASSPEKLAAAGASSSLVDDIRIAADTGRNAMIIYATPERYRSLETMLRQLDIMPAQILLEATVAEVKLIDNLKYGLEWYLKSRTGSPTEEILTKGAFGLQKFGGLSYSLVSERYEVLIHALAEEDLVKVLSSPRIMVRDGKTASLTVGDQIPVVTGETARVDSGGDQTTGVVRSFQYRSTGVTLQVAPTVHAQGIVTLAISQDVSEPGTSGSGENPPILNRTLSTEVVAGSGQTVLLGGLIKENNSRHESKIPLLGDLPGLGHLFKATSRDHDRTELVVMITPHIIRSTQQLDEIGRAILGQFQQLEAPGP